MKSKALIAFVIALIPIALESHTSAQQSCNLHDVAYLRWLTVIREKPALYGRAIRATWSKDGFPVTNSVPVRGDCWAKAPDGWLLAENLTEEPVPTPGPPKQTSVRLPRIEGDAEFVAQIARGYGVPARGSAALVSVCDAT